MNARASLLLFLSLLPTALCGVACDDSLKSVSAIEETRVLGARVEVELEPTRGSPKPGERASLRFFLAAPDGEPRFSYALSVCAVSLVNSGFPPCASAPFASARASDPSSADARIDFQVPADIDLVSTPHAFASGFFCPDSGLKFGSDGTPSCVTGKGIEVAFEFPLDGPDESNQNPTFAADTLSLDGEPWPASSTGSCDDGSLRQVPAKSRHVIQLDLADENFETLAQPTSVDPNRETLLVSPFSSAGKLQYAFLALSADAPPAQRRVSWDTPALGGGTPSVVHFYFVVRDTRSGEDFTERALCVVP